MLERVRERRGREGSWSSKKAVMADEGFLLGSFFTVYVFEVL